MYLYLHICFMPFQKILINDYNSQLVDFLIIGNLQWYSGYCNGKVSKDSISYRHLICSKVFREDENDGTVRRIASRRLLLTPLVASIAIDLDCINSKVLHFIGEYS